MCQARILGPSVENQTPGSDAGASHLYLVIKQIDLTCQFRFGDHSSFALGTVYSDTGVPFWFVLIYIFLEYTNFLKHQKSLTSNENRRTATWAGPC
jgi:hypothetical protein